MRFDIRRWRPLILATAGPLVHYSLRHVPLWAKFRTVPDGYQPRWWFKRAVIVSSVYEATRLPSRDLDLLSNAKAHDGAKR